MDEQINFKAIEKKWQEKWEKKKIFQVKESKKKKFYVLEMFPYPSGSGLHMGHAFNYTIGDIYARFKRAQGFNVLYPMGYDSLGLPAENAAIKEKIHPKKYTDTSVKNFIKQQKALGLSYDWSRMVKSHEPDYYKWDQWIFLKMFEKGLVYKKKASANFCPKCNSVLANEQVHNGKCWRHEDTDVETKELEQWFFKITDYAEELYDKIDSLNWPERIKIMQKNWIGKSYGTEIDFVINGKKWPIFTTRPDTIYGVTFMVISAQHPKLLEITSNDKKKQVEEFVKKCQKAGSAEETERLEKEGVFTGSFAENPLTNEKVPVYAGNFVLADYGCGMVMAVPAHDQRDFQFAKKYNLSIKEVVKGEKSSIKEKAYVDEGILVNSNKFDGLNSKDAIKEITKELEKRKLGKETKNFRLKDWLVSRQRYWGTPIPIVYCEKCGIVPVSEKELPIKLPEKVKFGIGNPLETAKNWINTKCPRCKGKAKRETDTMDTFVNSSWYFLRYCDSKNKKQIFDKKKVAYWMPIDQYIGGAEHACMHLIYFRFYTKFLRDLGLLNIDEPALKLFNQGMLHKDGVVMSKSKGNVVLPEEVSEKYGIDSARLFLVSLASPDKDIEWSEQGIQGSLRFINKVIEYFEKNKTKFKNEKSSERIASKLNSSIKEITEDIENFRYNLAVIKLRAVFEAFEQEKEISKKDAEVFLNLLSPFCPHIAEELWNKLGHKDFISLAEWPKADEKKIDKKFEIQDKATEKLKEDINNIKRIIESKGKKAEKVYVYVLPKELEFYKGLENEGINVFSVADKSKYDPQNKAGKAKPGKPAIYLE